MKKWISPKMVDLGIEDTKSCTKDHTGEGAFTLDNKSASSDSSGDGASSCSSDCPFDQES